MDEKEMQDILVMVLEETLLEVDRVDVVGNNQIAVSIAGEEMKMHHFLITVKQYF